MMSLENLHMLPASGLARAAKTARSMPGGCKLARSMLACMTLPACALPLAAQQAEPTVIAHTSARDVQVAGAVDLHGGDLQLGNGSTITASGQPVKISLDRGGQLLLCSTTSLHLSRDRSIPDPANTALMMALDRGAVEAHYTVGKYSDVLLTPDLRILISGPGEANLSVRVNGQGDTCVDNHGADAPYVTVTSQLAGGLYRVLPNQRVTFEHGSLSEMVDNEPGPCGCPATPAIDVASASKKPGQSAGGPSSTPADTAFPLEESEGLAPPPAAPTTPVAPAGQVHVEVTAPLVYNGEQPQPTTVAPAATTPPASTTTRAEASPPEAAQPHGVFHRIGHFFSRIFRV